MGDALHPPRRLLIILNPAAGRPNAKRRLVCLVAALERRGCSVVVRETAPVPLDAERLAREAEPDFDLIVAAGGDGTVNQVANGLHRSGRPMAVAPFGTANVLAQEIGAPSCPDRLADLIASAMPEPVWPGQIGDRIFLITAGCGFDADVVAAVDPRLKLRLGKLAFVWATARRLGAYQKSELDIDIGGTHHAASAVVVAKGRFYAGRFVLAPKARIADSLFYVVLFRRSGRVAAVRYLAAMILGRMPRLKDVSILPAREISISGPSQLIQADGEIVGRSPARFRLASAPLMLVRSAAPAE